MKSTLHTPTKTPCFHCGDECKTMSIAINDKHFCCNGCKTVYQVLNQNNLDNYYCLNENPGITVKEISETKFSFLDDKTIAAKLISFSNSTQSKVEFNLPQMHCSSCLWLLENLHKLNPHVLSSQVNFTKKNIHITFLHQHISLRQLAELLTSVGYEPHISQLELDKKETPKTNTTAIKIGVAGFCFANIMLISFPEYLGLSFEKETAIATYFRYLNVALALPVLLYSGQEFFVNAFHGFKQRYINIDAPIALAIAVTFLRSMYEIVTGTGAGYLDSGTGIIFFMLVGRALQNKTQSGLTFNRDYKSYFPIAVTCKNKNQEVTKQVEHIQTDDVLIIHHQEIIPVDCILSKGKAEVDYSFITGENATEFINIGELIYAGGRVAGPQIEVITVKPYSQNSFTQLWNNSVFRKKEEAESFVTRLGKNFAVGVFVAAIAGFFYWSVVDPTNALNALTAALIVACPCSLLLTSTFTFGYVIELFSKHGMFVKNAHTIEEMAKANHIVFDKTGTITEANTLRVEYHGTPLSKDESSILFSMMQQSMHPLSKAIVQANPDYQKIAIENCNERKNQGIDAWVNETHFRIGSAAFVGAEVPTDRASSYVFVKIEDTVKGYFRIENKVRAGVDHLFHQIVDYNVSLLSGDNNTSEEQMKKLFPANAQLLFQQKPEDKLHYVESLQESGQRVIMVGDGLNDAGALKQSDCGISVVENHFSFSPACDAILESKNLKNMQAYLQSAKATKLLIQFTFVYSILYNIVGLSYALSAQLQPVVAAVLMPSSSISIILISYFGTKWIERKYLLTK